ncbi:MAG: Rrf2 family transcriptional regulator, partial [Candidatus Omnitrophica bacterium]|nr:Rrf2 family transcriptional regulator [Candidatus Omnitrophota bacterium]
FYIILYYVNRVSSLIEKHMKITYKCDYAIKTVLDLALHYNELSTIHQIARRIDAPVKFLEQVLLDLKRGGFVESKRGKIGGYQLAREPVLIKLGEVIRFISGPIEPIACVEKDYSGCRETLNCVLRPVWGNVAQAISGIIDNINFEELAARVKDRKEVFTYSI